MDFRDLSEQQRSKFWLPGKRGLQHSKLRRYEKEFKLDKFFKFAFVRNPWDRAVSQISYLQRQTGKKFFSGNCFKDNIKIYCSSNKNIWGHDLGACQLDFLCDFSGRLRIDFLGRFESLEKDFVKACDILGIKPAPDLPHIFNSKRECHYSKFYDDESAKWIEEKFSKDINLFGYQFANDTSLIKLSETAM
jgi:hypothetical protein